MSTTDKDPGGFAFAAWLPRPWCFSLDGGFTWLTTARRPNRFHRAMQRLVFGIRWGQNK